MLTPKAAAEQAAFQAKKIEDKEAANCLPPGMPRIMSWQPLVHWRSGRNVLPEVGSLRS